MRSDVFPIMRYFKEKRRRGRKGGSVITYTVFLMSLCICHVSPTKTSVCVTHEDYRETSLVVWWFRLHLPGQELWGSIPGWVAAKILHAVGSKKKKKINSL